MRAVEPKEALGYCGLQFAHSHLATYLVHEKGFDYKRNDQYMPHYSAIDQLDLIQLLLRSTVLSAGIKPLPSTAAGAQPNQVRPQIARPIAPN
jgi:hypothetical protein